MLHIPTMLYDAASLCYRRALSVNYVILVIVIVA